MEKPLRFVPLITSTPLTGTGVGAAASYLYKVGEDSAKSQLQVGGQYSNTDSITTFVRNNAFLKANTLLSDTGFFWSDINSEFDGTDGRRVEYKIKSISLAQKLLFQVKDGVYWGGHVAYKDVKYSPNNETPRSGLRYWIEKVSGLLRMTLPPASMMPAWIAAG